MRMMPTIPMRREDLVVEGADLEEEEVGEAREVAVAVAVPNRFWLTEFVGW